MAKRGSRRGKPRRPPSINRSPADKFVRDLKEADNLLGNQKYVEAREAFQELNRRHPNQEDVLRGLANACYYLHDMVGYQYALEHLIKLSPDDPDVAVGLAGSYMTNLRLTLALRAFRHFLRRWPGDERAANAKGTIADLERMIAERLGKLGFTEDELDELGALHDESQVLMEQGRYAEARRVMERLIERKPQFTAVRNNLSLMWLAEGNPDAAIAAAREVLDLEPENYHALSNLVRFHVQSGRIEQARQYAERLKSVVEEEMTDVWLKKIEALSFLGDDRGVLEVFDQAQKSEHREMLKRDPMVFHLAAVAEMRLGKEERARALWRQALEFAPGFELALDNLDDLKKPEPERHAPWPFPLTSWISQRVFNDFVGQIESAVERGDHDAARLVVRRYLEERPEMATLVPILFDRGDPMARTLAMQLVALAKTPEMFAALRDFALSQRGPDQMRLQAAQIAREEGLLPEGAVRAWVKGQWQEVIQTTNEIHFDPLFNHSPEVSDLLVKGIKAVRKGDGFASERLLRRALALEPDSPDILNNLAVAYQAQGRIEERDQLTRRIHEQYPDYLFGIANLARLHTHLGEFDKAAELLKPLMSRKRLHHDELIAIYEANLHLYLAQGELDNARTWLTMWEQTDPDNPKLLEWRVRLEIPNAPNLLRSYPERDSPQ
jgi:tetratricopeptide (TPR) repeat protein